MCVCGGGMMNPYWVSAHAHSEAWKGSLEVHAVWVGIFQKATWGFSHSPLFVACWQLGCDWLRTVWVSSRRWKVSCTTAACKCYSRQMRRCGFLNQCVNVDKKSVWTSNWCFNWVNFFLWGAQNEAFCFLWTSYVATIILPHVSGSISEGIQGHIPTGGV